MDEDLARCHGCGGTAPRGPQARRPVGWLGLSVEVPPGYTRARDGTPRDYIWLGLWCSVACLEGDIPELEEQERLARMGYEAVDPELPDRPRSTRAAGRHQRREAG